MKALGTTPKPSGGTTAGFPMEGVIMSAVTDMGGRVYRTRTIEDPERLLRRLKRNKIVVYLFGCLTIISVVALIIAVAVGSKTAIGIASAACVAFYALFVFFFAYFKGQIAKKGVYLVQLWCDATKKTPEQFPRNYTELESYRDWFVESITELAKRVTTRFDLRGESYEALKKVKSQGVTLSKWPEKLTPAELPGVRNNHREERERALADHRDVLAKLRASYDSDVVMADSFHGEYVNLWNLARDLGRFYGGVNVLPTDEDGNPFDDLNKFRQHLRGRQGVQSVSVASQTAA